MSETLVIGDITLDTEDGSGVAFEVSYSSARKITKKTAQGDDDATATDGGLEVREVTVKIKWEDDEAANERGAQIVAALDPSKKSKGNPPTYAHIRRGLDLGALKNVRAVLVEKAKGPDDSGDGVNVYELTCSSWAKVKAGTGKTPDKADPADGKNWQGGNPNQVTPGATVNNFGGPGGGKVTFGTPPTPTVKP